MENQIYRIKGDDGGDIEFFVCKTNEINPYRNIREMAVQVIVGRRQLDATLEVIELESLIEYLTECKDYIIQFNASSVAETQSP